MKKLTAVLLLICIALCSVTVTACGKDDADATIATTSQKPAPSEPKPDPEVDTTDYFAQLSERLETAVEATAADFQYAYNEGEQTATIIKYKGSAKAVILPAMLDGKTVGAIADGAFAENTTLEILIIGDTVTQFGKGILRGCTALTTLSTPLLGADRTSAQFLGYLFGAEQYADNSKYTPASLQYLQMTGNLTEIPAYTFAECNDLLCVKLPDGVQKLGAFAFYNCSKLKTLNLDRLTSVGDYSLTGCSKLVRADFGTALTSVGLGAFQGCGALSSMTLPFVGGALDKNNYLGYIFGAEEPDFTAGYIPAYLRSITLLDTCTTLGDYAFFECSVIKSVMLPKTLTCIGVRAFEGCSALESIAFPGALKKIRENAFLGCSALKTVQFTEGLTEMGINAFYGCAAIGEIKLPASLKTLPASAFAGCTSLETVDFGGVSSVGKNAFWGCTSLKSVACENVSFAEGNDAVESLLRNEE